MRVFIIRRSDGAEVEDKPSWRPNYLLSDEFWWAEGNGGCDCNRHLLFELAHGREPADDECVCGSDRYAVRLEVDGAEPWSDL